MRFMSPRLGFESFFLLLLRHDLLVEELITGFSHFTAALPLRAALVKSHHNIFCCIKQRAEDYRRFTHFTMCCKEVTSQ